MSTSAPDIIELASPTSSIRPAHASTSARTISGSDSAVRIDAHGQHLPRPQTLPPQAVHAEGSRSIKNATDPEVPPVSPTRSDGAGSPGRAPQVHPDLVRYLDLFKKEIAFYARPELAEIFQRVSQLKRDAFARAAETGRRPNLLPAVRLLKTAMGHERDIDRGLKEASKMYSFISFPTNIVLAPLPAIVPAVVGANVGAIGNLIFQVGVAALTPQANTVTHLGVHGALELAHNGSSTIKADDKSLDLLTLARATSALDVARTRMADGETGAHGGLQRAQDAFDKAQVADEINHAAQFWQGNVKLGRLAFNVGSAIVGYWFGAKWGAISQGGGVLLTYGAQIAAVARDHVNRHHKQLETQIMVMSDDDWDDPQKVMKYMLGPLRARVKGATDFIESLALQLDQNLAEMEGFANRPEQRKHAALAERVGLKPEESAEYEGMPAEDERTPAQQGRHEWLHARRPRTSAEDEAYRLLESQRTRRRARFDAESGTMSKAIPHRALNAATRTTANVTGAIGEGVGYISSTLQRSSRRSGGSWAGKVGRGAVGALAYTGGLVDTAFNVTSFLAESMTNEGTDDSYQDNRDRLERLDNDIRTLKNLHRDPAKLVENVALLSAESQEILLTYMRTYEERTPGRLGPLSGFQMRPNTLRATLRAGLAKSKIPAEWIRMAGSKTSNTYSMIVGGPAPIQVVSSLVKVPIKYSTIDLVFDNVGKRVQGAHAIGGKALVLSVELFILLPGVVAALSVPYNANWKVRVGKEKRDKYARAELSIPVSPRGPFTRAAITEVLSDSFAFNREAGAYASLYGMIDYYIRSPKVARRARALLAEYRPATS